MMDDKIKPPDPNEPWPWPDEIRQPPQPKVRVFEGVSFESLEPDEVERIEGEFDPPLDRVGIGQHAPGVTEYVIPDGGGIMVTLPDGTRFLFHSSEWAWLYQLPPKK